MVADRAKCLGMTHTEAQEMAPGLIADVVAHRFAGEPSPWEGIGRAVN